MADEQLRLEVSADVSKAQADLNTFITTMGKMRGEGLALDDVIDQFDTSLTRVSKSLRDSSSSAKSGGSSLNSLSREYRELVSEVQSLEYAQRQAASNARNLQGGSASLTGLTPTQISQMEAAQRRTTTAYQTNTRAMRETATVTDEVSTATDTVTESLNTSTGSINAQRYALYDVAATYGAIGASLLALSGAAIKVGSDFETSFTAVERTSGLVGNAASELREELITLTTQIPLAFGEVADLASRGAQLGIASDQIESFTETVAKFVATSDTVTLDQAVEAFGRISNLLGDTDFEAFGSAISLVGVNAAATEAQIVKTTQELAPFASAVGMSTGEVIGLAAAVASLGQPPERARSAFLTLQRVMDTAVSEGSDNLRAFAQLLNMTTDEVSQLWKQDPAQFTKAFATALGGVDDLTTAFSVLGINERRAVQVFQALAADARNAGDGVSVLSKALKDQAVGYSEATELNRQYSLILDDLSSQWVILTNSINALIETVSGGAIPGLAALLASFSDIVNTVREFLTNEDAKRVAGFVLVLTAVVGVLASMRAVSALATASTYALVTAQAALQSTGAARGVLGLIGALIPGLANYTRMADGSVRVTYSLAGAMRALLRATIVLGVIGAATELLFNFGGAMQSIQAPMLWFLSTSEMFQRWGQAVLLTVSEVLGAIPLVGSALANAARDGAAALGRFAAISSAAQKSVPAWIESLQEVTEEASYIPPVFHGAEEAAGDLASGLDRAGSAAKNAAAEVVTLKDYASDLGSVMSRAFEIRFGSQTAMDQVTSRWIDLNEEMEDYRRKVRELSADRKVTQYFLTVAEAYGDTLRAGVLRSELADIDAELAEAQAGVSTELKGSSRAAIENRATITGLVKGYQDYITELAASGASQAELNRAVERSQREFEAQATALGYTTKELQPYIKSFRDMKTVIDNVPRNITVTANTNPALQALNEFEAAVKKLSGKTFTGPAIVPSASQKKMDRRLALESQINHLRSTLGHSASADRYTLQSIKFYSDKLASGNYKEGGYTGGGGTSAPAGIVHGKEFVFNAQATKNAGVGNLYGMMRSFEQGRGYQNGGYVGPRPAPAMSNGPNVFVLDQAQYQGLVNSGNVVVQIGPEKVANAVNNTNQQYANLGRS